MVGNLARKQHRGNLTYGFFNGIQLNDNLAGANDTYSLR